MVLGAMRMEGRWVAVGRSASPSGLRSPRSSKDELCRVGDLGGEGERLYPSALVDYSDLESLLLIIQKSVENLDRTVNGGRHIRSAEPLVEFLHLAEQFWVNVELYLYWFCHDGTPSDCPGCNQYALPKAQGIVRFFGKPPEK